MPKDKYIGYRILGSAAVLVIHIKLLVSAIQNLAPKLHLHPELMMLRQLGPRFLTNWNVLLQVAYTTLSLMCDVSTLLKMEALVPERVRSCRYYLFFALVFPLSGAVLSFWPYYLYDETLVIPPIALEYKLVSPACNMMFHAGVFFYVLWEILFLPRDCTKRPPGLTLGVVATVLYVSVLFYTRYGDLGVWCYEYFKYIDGTIMVYIAICYPIALFFVAYKLQWKLRDAIWEYRDFLSGRKGV